MVARLGEPGYWFQCTGVTRTERALHPDIRDLMLASYTLPYECLYGIVSTCSASYLNRLKPMVEISQGNSRSSKTVVVPRRGRARIPCLLGVTASRRKSTGVASEIKFGLQH